MTDPEQRLLWQHETLDQVCSQIPKTAREEMFDRLPKEVSMELQKSWSEQQADSLSIDIKLPFHLYTGIESC